jgi:excisionase family DNA binding protein
MGGVMNGPAYEPATNRDDVRRTSLRRGATHQLTLRTADDGHDLPPVLDLVQAAALLGVGRTTAYRLVHDGQWPTPVLRLGRLIKIPTQPLLELLAGIARGAG